MAGSGDDGRAGVRADMDQDGMGPEVALTRRLMLGFLLAAGSAAPALAGDTVLNVKPSSPQAAAVEANVTKGAKPGDLLTIKQPDLTMFELIRPEDMLILDFVLSNLVVTGQGAARQIRRVDPGKPGLMTVRFPPQAIAETVFPDLAGQPVPDIDRHGNLTSPPPAAPAVQIDKLTLANTRIAGQSKLVFIMPDDVAAIDFTTKAVLEACRTWRLNLDVRAIDAPATMTAIYDFDLVRLRLDAIVKAQKKALQGYKGGKDSVTALLNRAADTVAETLARAAANGTVPNEVETSALIDRAISWEIQSRTAPKPASGAARSTRTRAADRIAVTPAMRTAVDARATQKLAKMAQASQSGGLLPGAVAIMPDLTPRAIGRFATDIEAPYRLHMSPLASAGFTHSASLVNHGTLFAELWHTRMGTRVDDWVLDQHPEPVRALWADDLIKIDEFDPKKTLDGTWALSEVDRQGLVKLTSSKPASRPAMAKHLRLTALGAAFDFEGSWNETVSDIAGWKHVASIGRDQYVRVIYDGYLFPFGHSASLIKVSERKFSRQKSGGRVAGLMQKYYIIVRDRVRNYPAGNQPGQGRELPFLTVEITTRQTPDLAAPKGIKGLDSLYSSPAAAYQAFVPEVAEGGEMIFHLVGTDRAGRRIPFEMPLVFVSKTHNGVTTPTAETSDVGLLVNWYNSGTTESRRRVTLGSAVIRFSDAARDGKLATAPCETDYPAQNLLFKAQRATAAGDGANFFPAIETARIEIASYKQLLGRSVATDVKYHKDYAENGFDGTVNRSEMVFAVAFKPAVDAGTTDRFGGMVKPDLTPAGLSRLFGAVSDVDAFRVPEFDPAKALNGMTLLGFIPVSAVLETVDLIEQYRQIPKIVSEDRGDVIETTYAIERDRVLQYKSLFLPRPDEIAAEKDGKPPQLSIVTTVATPKSGPEPSVTVTATLRKFTINLFGFVGLNFDSLTLTIRPGHKTDVNPVLEPKTGVVFGGPLEFVNTLRDVIPMDGFSDPPGLDVTAEGITASYGLALPSIGVGAMTLQNVSLGAGFSLPFTGGGPTARFNFAEAHNPFNLTISLFGGGGFCAIEVGTQGVVRIDACLEFGAQIAIDLGVASGGVYVKGGFHFMWDDDKSQVSYECFVEMGGHLDVLGLVNVSLVFHLGLTYEKTDSHTRLFGSATLTVEIDIAFFSCSQDVSVERQFAGSDSDPSFQNFLPEPGLWEEYCDAFAA